MNTDRDKRYPGRLTDGASELGAGAAGPDRLPVLATSAPNTPASLLADDGRDDPPLKENPFAHDVFLTCGTVRVLVVDSVCSTPGDGVVRKSCDDLLLVGVLVSRAAELVL